MRFLARSPRVLFILPVLALVGAGCRATAPREGREAGGPLDSGADGAPAGADAIATPDAPPDGDVAIASPDAGVDAPMALPSRQSVRFHVSGHAGWVVTNGNDCAPLKITELATGRDLVLALPFQCGCECCPPGTTLTRAAPLALGATLTWDAREAVTYQETIDCPYNGERTRQITREVHRPVGPSRYRATLAVIRAVPASIQPFVMCRENPDQTISCDLLGCGGPSPLPSGLCASETVEVEFDLPPAGDLDVEVVVP
jgi:hypothetical protein